VIRLLGRSFAQARYILIAAAILLAGVQIVIVGQASQVQRSQSFGLVASLLPGFLQRGLGNRTMLLASFKGTVSFGYFHPVLCLVVVLVAMYFTTEITHEIESGLVDLELARAVPRYRLVVRSIVLAGAFAVAAVTLMGIGTSLGALIFDADRMDLPDTALRLRLLVNLLAVAACFSGYALFVASLSRRWSTAFTTAALTALLAYLVDFLALAWRPMQMLDWVSPFHYYPAIAVMAGDAPMTRNLLVLFVSAAVFMAAGAWQFQRRDL
jgi:ABC-type transport system involved in multi-copper enzyme maturation permease subunit